MIQTLLKIQDENEKFITQQGTIYNSRANSTENEKRSKLFRKPCIAKPDLPQRVSRVNKILKNHAIRDRAVQIGKICIEPKQHLNDFPIHIKRDQYE